MKKVITNRFKTFSLVAYVVLMITFGQIIYEKLCIFAQDNSKTNTEIIDEPNELQESDITTKIYRSTDSTAELLEQETNTGTAIEEDVFTKEDIIEKDKKSKSKIFKRAKTNKTDINQNNKNLFLPWVVLILLIVVLSVIFKFLLKKKL